uniref:Sugar phosphate transporter domain-containing protein n=1 Tax=Photinus pyralis TaxID=7054 RepID=A0A1Y1MDJ8_PHOPY
MQGSTKFMVCAAGIFVCYFYFGILQEKITRGKYSYDEVSENGAIRKVDERFTCALALVFVQCLVNYFFAKGMLYVKPHGEDTTPTIYCASSALTYLLAMVCSYMALQWVAFPTQVVGKAGKPIPVMVLGVLIGRKSYPLKKYVFVLMIVIGVILFMYKDKAGSKKVDGFGLGELLILLSLTMDGLTGAVQERIKAEAKPTAQQMMSGMNKFACIFVVVPILLSGELIKFIEFVTRHPTVLSNILLLALAGALGQLFIFLTVTEFGPLPCSVITTTRKFFTVLGSVLIFGNVLTVRQWIGAIIVFTGLFLDVFFSKGAPKKK